MDGYYAEESIRNIETVLLILIFLVLSFKFVAIKEK